MKKLSSSSNQLTMTKELNDAIKNLLGKHVKILFKCAVKLESKGDRTENRVLVLCPCRLFCLKVPPRIDFHFHYLEIQGIESKKLNQLTITAADRSHNFLIPDQQRAEDIDKVIVTVISALSETFPGIPLYNIIRRIDVVPFTRLQHLDLKFDGGSSSSGSGSLGSSSAAATITTPVPYPKSKSSSSLEENSSATYISLNSAPSPLGSLVAHAVENSPNFFTTSYSHLSANGPNSTGPCGGFSTQYAWMCDLYGLPYRDEVAWDVDTIYLSHDSRELCLRDFDHLEPRDLAPILGALEYNGWFKSLRSSHVKLAHEAIERLLQVVRKSVNIEELHLDNIGAKADFAQKLSSALTVNSNSQIHTLDLSHNMIEDKGAIHLSNPLAKLCRGPVRLNFSHCGLSAKGVAQLAHALLLNRCAPNSLTHLNLSGNSLKDDTNHLCNFLAQPNSITFLDLSGTDCTLETVFGALLRGCSTHLVQLNLSRNNFSTKKGKEIPPSFKQFLTSSLTLKHLMLSSCKLSLEALKQLLLGLACNESTADLELDISSNCLGQQGAHVLESCLHGIKCLASLDISDNNLDADLAGVVSAASKNKSLKHLNLGRNLQSTKAKHVSQVMDALVQMLQEEDCVVQTLSLAESKLKGELYSVINALGSNQCLQNIDISGNQMGDVGARLLAKALQINGKIRCITYDRNNITLQGFSDIAYGLESNVSVRYMPYPTHDVLPCLKVSAERTEAVMKRIQELIHRNSVPKKCSSGQQAFRLQQGFLISSAQQTMDKLISQTNEAVKLLRKNEFLSSKSPSETDSLEVINQAEDLIQDSEQAKQILLSLHEIIEQRGEHGKLIESELQNLATNLHGMLTEHIQSNINGILDLTEQKCPSLMRDGRLKDEIVESCTEKCSIPADLVRHSVIDMAGMDIINKLNEVHLAVAAHISDKLVDKAIDSLMKCHKQLTDMSNKRSSTPDVLKTRLRASPSEFSKELSETASVMAIDSTSKQLIDKSPVATPQMHSKRKGLHGRRIRPKSVVDCVEGTSADDIPDLLPSLPKTIEETMSSLHDLPPTSPQQLKHLGKARPKKPKTRAPTRPSLRPPQELVEEAGDLQDGLETFFRPGSATPTPIVTPDSDECSASLMISMTSNADDSIQSTPTHSSRTFKVDDSCSDKTSPGSFDSCSISNTLSLEPVPRSKSTDCLETSSPKGENLFTPGDYFKDNGQKSPVQKLGSSVGNSVLAEMKARQEKRCSGVFSNAVGGGGSSAKGGETPHTTAFSISEAKEKFSQKGGASGVNLRKPPPVAPKPRPWSVVGSERRSGEYSMESENTSPRASIANTPDTAEFLDENTNEGCIPQGTSTAAKSVTSCSTHLSIMESFAGLSSSESRGAQDTLPLSPSACSPSNRTLHINQNQTPISLPSSDESVSASIGAISNNMRDVNPVKYTNGNNGAAKPINLPAYVTPWSSGEKRSVKELAASLARQSSRPEPGPKRKSDSLPWKAPSSAVSSVDQQDTGFSRARVSLQQWASHNSEFWKVPNRSLSTDRTIFQEWDPSKTEAPINCNNFPATDDEDYINV